jgi:hypothetical protein
MILFKFSRKLLFFLIPTRNVFLVPALRSSNGSFKFILLALLISIGLASCNLQSNQSQEPTLNVTQAYQTVQARLTEAIALTPSATIAASATENSSAPQVSPSATLQPSLTPTEPRATGTTGGALCGQAAPGSPIDVTIADGTEMQPGQEFTKIWRLQNVGSCAWSEEYNLVWFSGDQLGAPASVPLSGPVQPGQTVDLSVDMIAPEDPGTYRGNWKLRNAEGVLFGIGPSGGSAFWVEIEVIPLPTGSPTAAPETTETPTPTPTVAVQVSGSAALTPEDRLDLDANQLNPGAGEDISLEAADGNHVLNPLNGAAIAVFGRTQPTLNDCQTASLNAGPIAVEDNLIPGIYLCYRTDMALPGWALVTAFDADTPTLSVELFTWSIP